MVPENRPLPQGVFMPLAVAVIATIGYRGANDSTQEDR